jgi:1-acyl-sn-glycerol-3-phosphate acyltransferase
MRVMNRATVLSRLYVALLILAYAAWMAAIGHVNLGLFTGEPGAGQPLTPFAVLAATILATVTIQMLAGPALPELAAVAGLTPGRVLTMFALAGVVGLWVGGTSALEGGAGHWAPQWAPRWDYAALPAAVTSLLVFFSLSFWPRRTATPEPFFLWDRSHAASSDARRSLAAGALQALVVTLAVVLALHHPANPDQPKSSPWMLAGLGAGYAVGVLISWWQEFPQRQVGLLPLAGWAAVVAALAAWIQPAAEWPVLLLGGACGLAHAGPRNWLDVMLPPGQRAKGLALMAIAYGIGISLALALLVGTALFPPAVLGGLRLLVCTIVAVLATRYFLRELVEQITEAVIWISYLVRGYGPGMRTVPTRGPILVIANHCAWLDPLWVAKVLPVQLRPMMTSRFYDLPVIRWLMKRVFHAIRVPEAGFRREAPEVQEAIAALQRGENVLIFPEGWLKRKEEKTLRRFGQGIYQILREMPRTPVVACWIEGGWGSYTSYYKGPPTRNKRFDWFRRIRIGVSDPEVLNLELLHDHLNTRRHLMLAVLNARTYLGLLALPPPPFAVAEDDQDDASAEGEE